MRVNKFKKKIKKLDKNFLIVVTIVFLFTTFFLIFLLDRSTQIGFNDPFNEIDSKINNFLIKGRQKYKNPHDYNLILNPKFSVCGYDLGKKITFIAFVAIAPHLFDQRIKIRESWGNSKVSSQFKVIFSIALSRNPLVNELVKEEFDKYHDIIQEDFIDSYYNLTLKVMMSFKWISEYCSNSHFTLRINDDVLLNSYALLNYLNSYLQKNNERAVNTMFGKIQSKMGPQRNPESKWHVSVKDFEGEIYDDFCSGIAYILSTDLTKRMYDYSLNFYMPRFSDFLEDVYVGMIAKRLNVIMVDIKEFYFPQYHYNKMKTKEKFIYLEKNFLNVIFITEKETMNLFWNLLKHLLKL